MIAGQGTVEGSAQNPSIRRNLLTHPMSKGVFYPDLPISVEVWRKKALISFQFSWSGEAEDILFPLPATSPKRRDSLWQQTCFEAFFSIGEGPGYWELNVSPSGDWNCYQFERYRFNGRTESRIEARHFREFKFDQKAKEIGFSFDLTTVLGGGSQELNLGIAAVIEKKDHLKAYLALSHVDAAPNFHLRPSFILRM